MQKKLVLAMVVIVVGSLETVLSVEKLELSDQKKITVRETRQTLLCAIQTRLLGFCGTGDTVTDQKIDDALIATASDYIQRNSKNKTEVVSLGDLLALVWEHEYNLHRTLNDTRKQFIDDLRSNNVPGAHNVQAYLKSLQLRFCTTNCINQEIIKHCSDACATAFNKNNKNSDNREELMSLAKNTFIKQYANSNLEDVFRAPELVCNLCLLESDFSDKNLSVFDVIMKKLHKASQAASDNYALKHEVSKMQRLIIKKTTDVQASQILKI